MDMSGMPDWAGDGSGDGNLDFSGMIDFNAGEATRRMISGEAPAQTTTGEAPAQTTPAGSDGGETPRRLVKQSRLTTDQKRQNHVNSEQKRRAGLRAAYDSLAQIVPEQESNARKEGLIMTKTVDHLRDMMEQNKKLREQLAALGEAPPGGPVKVQERSELAQLATLDNVLGAFDKEDGVDRRRRRPSESESESGKQWDKSDSEKNSKDETGSRKRGPSESETESVRQWGKSESAKNDSKEETGSQNRSGRGKKRREYEYDDDEDD